MSNKTKLHVTRRSWAVKRSPSAGFDRGPLAGAGKPYCWPIFGVRRRREPAKPGYNSVCEATFRRSGRNSPQKLRSRSETRADGKRLTASARQAVRLRRACVKPWARNPHSVRRVFQYSSHQPLALSIRRARMSSTWSGCHHAPDILGSVRISQRDLA